MCSRLLLLLIHAVSEAVFHEKSHKLSFWGDNPWELRRQTLGKRAKMWTRPTPPPAYSHCKVCGRLAEKHKNPEHWRMLSVTTAFLLSQRFLSFSAVFSCALIKTAFTWPSGNKGVVLKHSKLWCKQLSFRYKRFAEFISKPHCDCQKWKSPGLMAGSQVSWYIVQQRENSKANLEKTTKNERLNWNNFATKRGRNPRRRDFLFF